MVEADRSATRARYMKTFVAAIERLGADEARRIRDRVSPETFQIIDRAGGLTWLPIEVNTTLTEAVMRELDPAGGKRFFQGLMLDAFETPLFDGFIKASVRLLGLDPGALVKVVGKIHGIMFREAGAWRVVDRNPGGARLRIEGLAQACRSEIWVTSVAWSLSALFPFTDRVGEVRMETTKLDEGVVEFAVRWS